MQFMAHDVTDFEAEVLAESQTTPVVVDFWAPWCGPCRFLGPVLERLAEEEADGRWKLAKLNTDQYPEISARYGIQGIPAVKLFVDGEVIDEFTGALPEQAVRQWLDKALPSENKKRLSAAEAALDEGDHLRAEKLLREVLGEEPGNARASLLLARLVLFENPDEAIALAEGAPFAGPEFLQLEESIKTVARLLTFDTETSALPEAPVRARYLEAVGALRKQDFDGALSAFIDVIRTNRYYDDDGARKACIAIFSLLGEQHPITRKHRRSFDMALY